MIDWMDEWKDEWLVGLWDRRICGEIDRWIYE